MKKKLLIVSALAFSVIFLAGCSKQEESDSMEKDEMVAIEDTMEASTMEPEDEMMEEDEMMDEAEEGYMNISVQEAKKMIDDNPDLIIVDVSPNYDKGHLPGAVNYYVGDGSLDEAIPSLDKDAIYLVYCHVDSAAILGAQKMIDAGFENVYRMEGNYSGWVAAGYPVER